MRYCCELRAPAIRMSQGERRRHSVGGGLKACPSRSQRSDVNGGEGLIQPLRNIRRRCVAFLPQKIDDICTRQNDDRLLVGADLAVGLEGNMPCGDEDSELAMT